MIQNREEWLADTLVMLADTLVTEFDVVEFLSALCERMAELLDAAEVGLMMAAPQGRLQVMAATTERMRMTDLFELQSNEGPCLDCYQSGSPLLNVSLEDPEATTRWPTFTPMARATGFQMVHAVPMQLRDQVIGAANICHSSRVRITPHDAHLAQALVDAATIGVLQERAIDHGTVLAEQLQHALDTRVIIEQAKGVVAEQANVDMSTAFEMLRSHARANRMRLAKVAERVIDRTLSVNLLRREASAGVDTTDGDI